jgi:hypothetical protein
MDRNHRQRIIANALPIVGALAFLWFPFDWLSEVWPAFGVPFRTVFRNAHDHFVGHSIFFFVIGIFIFLRLKSLVRIPVLYFALMILAALTQETIQSIFRHQIPRFDDFNAFKGDALGSICAFAVMWLLSKRRRNITKPSA